MKTAAGEQASLTDDGTIERYRSYLEVDPENGTLWIALGDLYRGRGAYGDARECYRRALATGQTDAIANGRVGMSALDHGDFPAAEESFRATLAETPDNANLLHNLGVAVFLQRRWQEAAEALESARAAGCTDPRNAMFLTRALHNAGAHERALEMAASWRALDDTAGAQAYTALIEMDSGAMEDAVERARDVLGTDEDNADANTVLGMHSLEEQSLEAARHHFERATTSEPTNPRGWTGLGLTELQAGRADAAIESLRHANNLAAGQTGLLTTLGWAHLMNQDPARAEATFRDAVAADRTFGEAYGGLASALAFQNRRDEAREAAATAGRLDRRGFGAAFANSVLLEVEGDHEKATRLLAKAFQHAPRPGGQSIEEAISRLLRDRAPTAAPAPPATRQP